MKIPFVSVQTSYVLLNCINTNWSCCALARRISNNETYGYDIFLIILRDNEVGNKDLNIFLYSIFFLYFLLPIIIFWWTALSITG